MGRGEPTYVHSPYSILTFIMFAPNESKKVDRNGHQAEENAGVQRQSVCIVYVRTYVRTSVLYTVIHVCTCTSVCLCISLAVAILNNYVCT